MKAFVQTKSRENADRKLSSFLNDLSWKYVEKERVKMNIRLFRNNLPRIVLRPFYFSFFFQFFFLFKVLFVFFFFLVTITAPRWTIERREEKEIATKMIECLFFSFFRLLMAFDFLPCNFTLEAVSFGSMLIQHYEHLQIAIEIFFLKLSHVSRLCLRCDELLKTIGRN